MGNIYIAAYTLAAIVMAGLTLLPVAWWQWTKRKTGSRRTWEATGLAAISLGVALYFGILILAGLCHWTPNDAAPYERIVAALGTPLTVYSVVIAFARSGRPRWALVTSSLSIGLLYTLAVLGAFSP